MPSLGPLEIVVIFVVALLVFGPQKLPELGRQLGKALREFQRVQDSFQNEVRSAFDVSDPTPPMAPSPPMRRAYQIPGAEPAPDVGSEPSVAAPPETPSHLDDTNAGSEAGDAGPT